jgi:hypothetical protein
MEGEYLSVGLTALPAYMDRPHHRPGSPQARAFRLGQPRFSLHISFPSLLLVPPAAPGVAAAAPLVGDVTVCRLARAPLLCLFFPPALGVFSFLHRSHATPCHPFFFLGSPPAGTPPSIVFFPLSACESRHNPRNWVFARLIN